MRKTLALIVALCVGSAIGGCNSNSNNKDNKVAPPAEETRVNPNWELKLQSKCAESVTAAQGNCVGEYGFTVLTDGHYKVGPGPKKEIREGTLTAEEMELLNKALAPSLSITSAEPDNRQDIAAGDSDDTITLTRGESNLNLLETKGTNLYYANASADDAKAIHDVVRKLALKYYALPFPEPCMDGASALETLYTSLQSCNADADCTYLDDQFNVLPSSSPTPVITDDCTMVRSLSVANASLVASKRDTLIAQWNELSNSCGEKFRRQDCVQMTQFQPNNRAPICSQGTCQVPQASSTSPTSPTSSTSFR